MSKTDVKLIADIGNLSYEQLRIEFMRMSPTYQLITKWYDAPTSVFDVYLKALQESLPFNIKRGLFDIDTKKFNAKQIASFEKMFDKTYETFEQYGDINKPYSSWWKERGHLIFDSASNQATVRDLGTIDSSEVRKTLPNVRANLIALGKTTDSRHHIILSVPMYMLHKDAMEQISQLLSTNLFSGKKQIKLRKPVLGLRKRHEPLLKKLKLLMYRCMYPDESMIELGFRSNISPRNEVIVANKHKSFTQEEVDAARRRIGLAASRAMTAAEAIAERASRDIFPHPQVALQLPFDWELNRKNLLKAWPALKG